jgi:hypothetical protein
MKNGLKDGDVFDIAIVMMARVQWTCYLRVHIASTYVENNLLGFVTICITMIFLWWNCFFRFAYSNVWLPR